MFSEWLHLLKPGGPNLLRNERRRLELLRCFPDGSMERVLLLQILLGKSTSKGVQTVHASIWACPFGGYRWFSRDTKRKTTHLGVPLF